MRILAVDVGTGTQDILLFDSERELENCFRLVMPAPTVVIADRIRAATARQEAVLLVGSTMGGGPCAWAATDHLAAGLAVYATPDAARTFDDDLEGVARMGVTLISDDEALLIQHATRIELRDLWLDAILSALATFDVGAQLDALAVAVFDHGAAPPGYSDRVFRFDYLAERLETSGRLADFAFPAAAIPPSMTRLVAVARSAPRDLPTFVMDTAPAAVLGALEDARIARERRVVVANIGNFHTLAFNFENGRILGLFEHHSGELTGSRLASYLNQLAAGTISNDEVYRDMGHGALTLSPPSDRSLPVVSVTGPRRALLANEGVSPYLAVPHGDMMLAGCFGLLRAVAARDPAVAEAVDRRLGPPGRAVA
ncbi:MAG: DUF1786 domain-containing protein [Chloroflexi bacterium]|nr:DUF1786 domain-containing protein [Chloroflexota bacterium]